MRQPQTGMCASFGPYDARWRLKRAGSLSPPDLSRHTMEEGWCLTYPVPPIEACSATTRSRVACHPSPVQEILSGLQSLQDLYPSRENKSYSTPSAPVAGGPTGTLVSASRGSIESVPFPEGCATARRLDPLQGVPVGTPVSISRGPAKPAYLSGRVCYRDTQSGSPASTAIYILVRGTFNEGKQARKK